MTKRVLPQLSRLALDATHETPATDVLVRAMDLVAGQTAAISALLFYGDGGTFQGAGVGDAP